MSVTFCDSLMLSGALTLGVLLWQCRHGWLFVIGGVAGGLALAWFLP